MAESIIPPWVTPESPEKIGFVDDGTTVFEPTFSRGNIQAQIWNDPRWKFTRRYRGMRADQKSALLTALNEARGKGISVRMAPHTPIRGSFPCPELLSNNMFNNGTTGWQGYIGASDLVVADRVLQVIANQSGSHGFNNTTGITAQTLYAPYALRSHIMPGRDAGINGNLRWGLSIGGNEFTGAWTFTDWGLLTVWAVPYSAAASYIVVGGYNSLTGLSAGAYSLCPYVSLARCFLLDCRQNLLLRSAEFDNASWTKTRCSIVANSVADPTSAVAADTIVEDATASSTHLVSQSQSVVVSTSGLDYCFTVSLKANTRTWAAIRMLEDSASGITSAYINLATGALGTVAAGSNWADARAYVVAQGNGWYQVSLVARKTNAATSITVGIMLATGDLTTSYTGNGTSSIYAWGATLAQSGVPSRSASTTSASFPGPTGKGIVSPSGLLVKGLFPVSTNGLLLPGDWVEIDGELKMVTAPLNSDAGGFGTLQIRPGLVRTPDDNTPVIVNNPMGRFRLMNGADLDNLFGMYIDTELEFLESYV